MTESKPIQPVFLHGLESGPHGGKSTALAAALPDLIAPDCAGMMGVDERLAHIEAELAGLERLLLVGSSFGGLMACLFASRNPERVAAMVLCAPALHDRLRVHVAKIRRVPAHCVILHGTRDDTVPIQASRDFGERFGVQLVELDDDHRLSGSRDVIVQWALKYGAR